MITESEILGENDPNKLSKEIMDNIAVLLVRVNKVRKLWGRPMIVTSGLRSMEHHLEIYKRKGITDVSKIPLKSKHLYGQACDILDQDLSITGWLKNRPEVLEECDLYCEEGNKNWVHFQSVPFGSYKPGGTRWFLP